MPFQIIRQDITKLSVDAIVNAANIHLRMGSGVCGAIFKAAGAEKLQVACDKLSPIGVGEAVLTPAFALSCKHIIHTAGPIYAQHSPNESRRLLQAAYRNALQIASDHKCDSIAFPLIASGIYSYPKADALAVATETIQSFLETHEMEVYLTVFDREAFSASKAILGKVASYIDQYYVDEQTPYRRGLSAMESQISCMPKAAHTVGEMLSSQDKPFGDTLMELIDQRGKSDVEIYKKANIDRKLFSKIRIGKGYLPSKRTVISLALALELSLAETDDLLECAGYALSHSQKFDVIIEYFIVSGKYDIFAINEVLFQYDLPLLGV